MLPIIANQNKTFLLSGILFIASVIVLIIFGLKPGIDFTGGTLLEVRFSEIRPSVEELQEIIQSENIGAAVIQPTDDNGYIVKTRFISEDEHQQLLSALRQRVGDTTDGSLETQPEVVVESADGSDVVVNVERTAPEESAIGPRVTEERIETIGPSISTELQRRSWQVGITVIVAIVLFIAYSFRKVSKPISSWKYGLAAIIALIHDVVITMGVFAVLGKVYGVEVDIPFVVAMLTIFGYSVNDTIVVFDRIREKLIRRGATHFAETVNIGVNETIARSINTAFTTLLVLVALFFFGGDSIHYFSLALIIGIALGTYSSIFLASPLLVAWEKLRHRQV